jgi:tRNA nucleotidyltransferase (CCA-adding enzyme)
LLTKLGAFKENHRLEDFALACKADARGRTGFEDCEYASADFLLAAAQVAASVDTTEVLRSGLQGAKIGEAIRRLRIKAVTEFSLNV